MQSKTNRNLWYTTARKLLVHRAARINVNPLEQLSSQRELRILEGIISAAFGKVVTCQSAAPLVPIIEGNKRKIESL
jgi:hypothetical protein